MRNMIIGLMLLVAPAMNAAAADKAADTCAPEGDLKFVCGVTAPEDLLPLPGGKWFVTGGMELKSGLHLINVTKKSAERWTPAPMAAATAPYQACVSAPDMDQMRAHGIAVRDRGEGRATLYVVNHAGPGPLEFAASRGREAVEVFDVNMKGAKPSLSWAGCVALPPGLVANSVTSTPGGTILITVMLHPGTTFADHLAGRPTGAVYQWHPGDDGFGRVWGTELSGNNGIEVSPDGQTLYVAAHGGINVFSNTNPAKLIQHVPVTEGATDNLHWVDGKVVGAGLKASTDPACADIFKAMSGELGEKCIPGYFAVTLDPATLKVTTLATGPGTNSFAGVATGYPIGKTLWLSSFRADRVAYRMLR